MKILKGLFGFLVLLVIVFLLGPKPDYPAISATLPTLNNSLADLPQLLVKNDAEVKDLRPGNASQLVYADSIRQTEYVLLYLHGFSASPVEGQPIHLEIAKHYNMNFYAPLLADHGSASKESFLETSPQDWMEDASEALVVAQLLGKKIIVMSCSTGSTLAVYLAAKYPEFITAHVMYSPNFDLADRNSKLMSYPWGLQLSKMVLGSDYRSFKLSPEAQPFWTTTYRIEGLIALRTLLDETMTEETWSAFDDPYLIAYYYESPTKKDNIISVAAIEQFHKTNGTAVDAKHLAPLAEPKSHVIASSYQSQNIDVVRAATIAFLDQLID